jgi:xanthine dehydrogenase accessory factor
MKVCAQTSLRTPAGAPQTAQPLPPATRGGVPGLLETLASIHAQGEVGVLGLVYDTTGSTYQKPGATVLLDRSGVRHGAISGGCLEPQLEQRAAEVCTNGVADTIEFDARSENDLIFGGATGCRGRIRLLLLPQLPGAPLARALAKLGDAAEPLQLRLVTDGPQIGSGCASLHDERWHWGRDGQAVAAASLVECSAQTAASVHLQIEPPPRVLLLGSGPEAPALNFFMQRLGWLATVVEHRGRWLKFARSANIKDLIELPPDEAAERWKQQRFLAAVIMTHNYALDAAHLAHCARSTLPYVGLLGPAARRDSLLAQIGESQAAMLGDRLHAPVGLGLGGSGPEALALSIVAELQQHFAHRSR